MIRIPVRYRRRATLVSAMLAVFVLATFACSGKSEIATGTTYPQDEFTESAARSTFEAAVMSGCSGSLGISVELSSALRIVDSALARSVSGEWVFSFDDHSASVDSTGTVSGSLLKDLTSDC